MGSSEHQIQLGQEIGRILEESLEDTGDFVDFTDAL